MHLLYCTRDDLLGALPPGGVAAEIGVATGGFSQIILRRAQPRQLHLVDPWEFQERSDYLNDANNVPQEVADSRYNDVKQRFAEQIANNSVVLHRAYSVQAASEIADGSLDWIFVDAMHTREAVLEDLAAWSAKVKSDGFILGHDYANHSRAMEAGFGVVEAVREFCETNDYHFAFLTAEPYPTYLIVKDMASEAWSKLKYTVIKSLPCVAELTDPFKLKYKQREYDSGNGQRKVIFSFAPLPAQTITERPAAAKADTVIPLLCRPGTLVDTGAGRHAATLAALRETRIIALEPSASRFSALCSELTARHGGSLPAHITLYNAAAGEEFGIGQAIDGKPPLVVPLDQYRLDDLTFLSLEADGSEAAVLRGAAETITRCAPVVRLGIPTEFDKAKIHDATSLLQARDYLGFVMFAGQMADYAAFESGSDISAVLFIRKDDVWGLRRLGELAASLLDKLERRAG